MRGKSIIIIGFFVAASVAVIFHLGEPVFFAIAVLTSEKNTIEQTWEPKKGYKVNLVRNSAWAGPQNFRYILYTGEDRVGISYSGTTLSDDDSCRIEFKPGDGFGREVNFIWDKCLDELQIVSE